MSSDEAETPCGVPDLLYDAHVHILPFINRLKSVFVTKKDNEVVKCTIHFGKMEHGAFNNELPRMFFMQTLLMLQRFQDWNNVNPSYDTHDYYYTLNLPVHKPKKQKTLLPAFDDNKTVRSRTHFIKTAGRYNMQVEHSYCQDNTAVLLHVNNRSNIDVRIEMTQVCNVIPQSIPIVVEPFHVCLRTQTVFCLENWKFMFIREWAAPTRLEAETKQFRDKEKDMCAHRLQIEFIGTSDYINNLTPDYFSVSLLLKICSLLGGNIIHLNPIHPQ